MSSAILLDTHVALWLLLEPWKLSDITRQHIRAAREGSRLFLSSISLWEIALLKSKKRINILESTKELLQIIIKLADNFHPDPSDRIMAATAMCHDATLITRDQKILEWGSLGHIKILRA